jgi:hypothetical protein
MMRFAFVLVAVVSAFLSASSMCAADGYFVRFNALGKSNATYATRWRDDILFFNQNAAPVDVKFVGVSNGTPGPNTPPLTLPPGPNTPPLTLPPGVAISLNANEAVEQAWSPVGGPSLWVLHLDVPSGVVVESRDEFFAASLVGFPLAFPGGKVSMPVFRQLAPANARQVILGTDLMASPTRINVGVYNGGADTAATTIELRRVGDNTLVDIKSVSVAANTIVQVGAFSLPVTDPAINYQLYTVVTVSQPSLVYVANLNDSQQTPPVEEEGLFPIVGLAVAINQSF